ncbi:MAG: hypothetical protein GXP62_18075, partial [Oligoflexia bacterium]|nr:hypothetical protein [Oligoflexia bacterium]
LFGVDGPVEVQTHEEARTWLGEVLNAARPGQPPLTVREAQDACPVGRKQRARLLAAAREAGLVQV